MRPVTGASCEVSVAGSSTRRGAAEHVLEHVGAEDAQPDDLAAHDLGGLTAGRRAGGLRAGGDRQAVEADQRGAVEHADEGADERLELVEHAWRAGRRAPAARRRAGALRGVERRLRERRPQPAPRSAAVRALRERGERRGQAGHGGDQRRAGERLPRGSGRPGAARWRPARPRVGRGGGRRRARASAAASRRLGGRDGRRARPARRPWRRRSRPASAACAASRAALRSSIVVVTRSSSETSSFSTLDGEQRQVEPERGEQVGDARQGEVGDLERLAAQRARRSVTVEPTSSRAVERGAAGRAARRRRARWPPPWW